MYYEEAIVFELQQEDVINPSNASTRRINILLFGRSQAEKHAVVQILKDTIGSEDTEADKTDNNGAPRHYWLGTEYRGAIHHLHIICVPYENGKSVDQLLRNAITRSMSVDDVNVVCFVTEAGRTGLEDVTHFAAVQALLGNQFAPISMVLMTHCDDYTEAKVDSFITTLKEHGSSAQVIKYCGMGFYRFGSIDSSRASGSDGTSKKKQEMNRQYRRSFLEAVIDNANTGIPLAHLRKSGTTMSHFVSHITSLLTPRSWLITKMWKKHILPQINRRNSIALFVLICVGVGVRACYAWRVFNASLESHFSLYLAVSKLIESYAPDMPDISFNVPEVPRYHFERSCNVPGMLQCCIGRNVFNDTGNY